MPTVDGQTVLSIIIGLAATSLTFWIAYRKTIGAREERVHAANRDILATVLQRIAVEREVLSDAQFEAIRKARSYRSDAPFHRLFIFREVLEIVLSDVLENRFLDKQAKNDVIGVIERCRTNSVLEAVHESDTNVAEQKRKYIATLAFVSGAVGFAISTLYYIASEKIAEADQAFYRLVMAVSILAGVLTASSLMITRRFGRFNRERDYQHRRVQSYFSTATARFKSDNDL
ncbi:hypothetical protein [Phyllobacterium salinisoli]|uniref:hypothetical protein n=1 Tax=Phyllobacterium salinisoli TaxID=1899321 RepID=UPI0011C06BAE|nr:hypothetical protein [Phyllobacterium salinisoli]